MLILGKAFDSQPASQTLVGQERRYQMKTLWPQEDNGTIWPPSLFGFFRCLLLAGWRGFSRGASLRLSSERRAHLTPRPLRQDDEPASLHGTQLNPLARIHGAFCQIGPRKAKKGTSGNQIRQLKGSRSAVELQLVSAKPRSQLDRAALNSDAETPNSSGRAQAKAEMETRRGGSESCHGRLLRSAGPIRSQAGRFIVVGGTASAVLDINRGKEIHLVGRLNWIHLALVQTATCCSDCLFA